MAVPSELIDTILTRTREGKLEWSELSRAGFTAPIGTNSITIDRVGGGGYVLRIANENGTVIERTTIEDRGSPTLEEIYETARRQALRVDETLYNIKRNLEEL